jgi:lysyl-tRNA synthetase class 1
LAVDGFSDWVARLADDVQAEARRRPTDTAITCASGISPSGPIHLGNLREVMVPHLVADELLRRGVQCRHILSWDDYDRLRKVPAGYPDSFAEHIGRPLTSVPDPCGRHTDWADHFKAGFRDALNEMGIAVAEVSQTERYTSGAYQTQIRTAMRQRETIDTVLATYRTKQSETAEDDPASYYPYRPYCPRCDRDSTVVTGFDDDTTEIEYRCRCDAQVHRGLLADTPGKLVWKVDWPMRWAFEAVTFEAAGVDHSSPGSSFTVGSRLVREVFGAEPPHFIGYSFVGTSGAAKLSGSRGGAPTPTDALRILEAPLLRWLYIRRRPNQAITLSFDQEVIRTYEEWDALARNVAAGTAAQVDQAIHSRAVTTMASVVHQTPRPLPFRLLSSVADITAGDPAQILRILRDVTADDPIGTLEETRPRLDCAQHWVTEHLPPQDRTRVRAEPDRTLLAELTATQREAVKLLLNKLEGSWSLDGLTTLLYGIPKIQLGLPLDTRPTPELKASQRAWFVLLYRLLLGSDTGPRLPTLLLALGPERLRTLLAA